MHTPHTKISSKWITDLNIRAKSTIILENIGINLHDFELGKGLSAMTPKAKVTRWKIVNETSLKLKAFVHQTTLSRGQPRGLVVKFSVLYFSNPGLVPGCRPILFVNCHAVVATYIQNRRRLATDVSSGQIFLSKIKKTLSEEWKDNQQN